MLRPIKADDSDDTLLYKDDETEQTKPKQEIPDDVQGPEDTGTQDDETKEQKGPKK